MFNLINRLNVLGNRFRDATLFVADLLGLGGPVFAKRGGIVILMYHGVVPEHPSRFNWRHVSVKDFEIHLKLLRRHCNVLCIADLFVGNLCPRRLNVALTFDDGFRNNFLHALPLLEKYRVPASFYVTGANEIGVPYLWPDFLDIVSFHADMDVYIGGQCFRKSGKRYVCVSTGKPLASVIKEDRPDWFFKLEMFTAFRRFEPNLFRPDWRQYWELMSDDEIRQTASSDWVTIGSHGYYHNNLGTLDLQAATSELCKSIEYLEPLIGKKPAEIAYPDGSYSSSMLKAASRLGFSIQLAVDHRLGESANCKTPARRSGIYSWSPSRLQLIDAIAKTGQQLV